MISVKAYPANEKHFIRLKSFAKKILDICTEAGAVPVVWGSMACFGYTKNKEIVVNVNQFRMPVMMIEAGIY